MWSRRYGYFGGLRGRSHGRKRFTKVCYFARAFGTVFQMQFRYVAVQSIKLIVNERLDGSWIEMVRFFAFLRKQMVTKRLCRDSFSLRGYHLSSASLTTENVIVNYSAVSNR